MDKKHRKHDLKTVTKRWIYCIFFSVSCRSQSACQSFLGGVIFGRNFEDPSVGVRPPPLPPRWGIEPPIRPSRTALGVGQTVNCDAKLKRLGVRQKRGGRYCERVLKCRKAKSRVLLYGFYCDGLLEFCAPSLAMVWGII